MGGRRSAVRVSKGGAFGACEALGRGGSIGIIELEAEGTE